MPTAPDTTVAQDTQSDPFIQTLRDRLMSTAGATSSQDSKIETTIADAIAQVNKSKDAAAAKTESEFSRAADATALAGQQALTTEQESQRGYATNTAALKSITDTTDKNLKDLLQRKQELILSGEVAAADKITSLMLQGLEFKQKSEQRIFENLISAGSFSLNANADKRAADAQKFNQSFQEKSAISNIALQYGVAVKPGDTIDTVTARAIPFASEKQKLEITKLKAEITRANAEAAKAAKGDTFELDPTTAGGIASTIQNYLATGRTDLADAMLANVSKQYGTKGWQMVATAQQKNVDQEYRPENLKTSILDDYNNGASFGDITKTINDNPFSTADQKKLALKIAEDLRPVDTSGVVTLPGIVMDAAKGQLQGFGNLMGFLGFASPERVASTNKKIQEIK